MLDLTATAARIGHYTWYERRLFEVVGGWVSTTDVADVEVKIWFAQESNHHAWHAELWHQRLPELREFDRASLTAPGSPAQESLLNELAESTSTLDRLVGLVRVAIPRLVVALDEHADRASPVADGPVLRTIRLVRSDLLDDWAAGERLVQRQLHGVAGVRLAMATQGRFEELLGGSVGFGGFPALG